MKTDAVNLKYEKVGGSGTSGSLVLRVNVVFDFVDDKAQLETSQIASVDVGIVNADGKNLCSK